MIVELEQRAALRPLISVGGKALACLHDAGMAGRFHMWRGHSGQRYLATVFLVDHSCPAAALPDLGPAVLLSVIRDGTERSINGGLVIERGSDWARAVERLHGQADEWHVHLLASERAARRAVLTDLLPVCSIVAAI